MSMLVESLQDVLDDLDVTRCLKQNFLLNALDGNEDLFVSDRLFSLIGQETIDFRTELMDRPPPRNFNDMVKTITPPEGVRLANVDGPPEDEGVELLLAEDGEDEDVELLLAEDGELWGINLLLDEETTAPSSIGTSSTNSSTMFGDHLFATTTDDTKINNDGNFINDLAELLGNHGKTISTSMMPSYMKIRAGYVLGRKNLKRRLESMPPSQSITTLEVKLL